MPQRLLCLFAAVSGDGAGILLAAPGGTCTQLPVPVPRALYRRKDEGWGGQMIKYQAESVCVLREAHCRIFTPRILRLICRWLWANIQNPAQI